MVSFSIISIFQKFLYYVLKSSDVLEILVPILYHLNDSRADQCEWNSVFFIYVLSFLEPAGILSLTSIFINVSEYIFVLAADIC